MAKFFTELFSRKEANVIVFGVPLGKNSERMLSSLRETSRFVEPFTLEKEKNLLEKIKICDMGNIQIKDLDNIFRQTRKIMDEGKVPLVLGKSHLLSLYTLGALQEDMRVVIFDAHADLADEYIDEKIVESVKGAAFEDKKMAISRFNCYTWLRRFCELVGTRKIALIGTRACSEEEFRFMQENKILYFTPAQIRKDLNEVKRRLEEFVGNCRVYVSLDMDFFDPSVAPAVDHPEPAGLLFPEFQELIEVLRGKIVGIDIVELSPIEGNKVTEFLAVKAIFELLNACYLS